MLAEARWPRGLQVFAICAASPAQILSLQKIHGRLADPGALETIAHYLAVLIGASEAARRHWPGSLRRARARRWPARSA